MQIDLQLAFKTTKPRQQMTFSCWINKLFGLLCSKPQTNTKTKSTKNSCQQIVSKEFPLDMEKHTMKL